MLIPPMMDDFFKRLEREHKTVHTRLHGLTPGPEMNMAYGSYNTLCAILGWPECRKIQKERMLQMVKKEESSHEEK